MRTKSGLPVILLAGTTAALGYWAGTHGALEKSVLAGEANAAPKQKVEFKTQDNTATLRAMLRKPLLQRFLGLWGANSQGWFANTWLGVETVQNPLDVWITQEILYEVKPDFLVETGTLKGGSAALWATLLAQINPDARIVTVDIDDYVTQAKEIPIVQEKVDFLLGSSTDPAIFAEIEKKVEGGRVMVILDSAHTRDHVIEELKLYSKLVPVGSYLIVQDTGMGTPASASWRWANMAVDEFIASTDRFVVDRSRERLVLTNNPGGFLKRVK